MKSFRFSLHYRPHLVMPSKRREVYSSDELMAFQVEFQRLWKLRKKRLLSFYACLGVWATGMIAAFLFSGNRRDECILALMLFFLAMIAYAAVFMGFPRCPACTNQTDEYPVEYCQFCPGCGGMEIGPATWLKTPRCEDCGITLRFGKGRDFRIRFCTSCGVKLDDDGV